MELQAALELLFREARGQEERNKEYIPITQALGRVLAEDIFATLSMPPFSNAAMDGYAVRLKDRGGSVEIVGGILAGDKESRTLKDGETYKIMTGASIPLGTEAVVPFEDTKLEHSLVVKFGEVGERVLLGEFKEGANIRETGSEYRIGDLLLKKGSVLDTYALGILASQGIAYVRVFCALSVFVYSSGDEIREFWQSSEYGEIYNSNTILTQSLLKSFHISACYGGKVPDDKEKLKEVFLHTCSKDVSNILFLTGGASKGEADFMLEVLESLGASVLFNGLNIKPGKPIKVLKLHKTYIFVLPGNPLAASVLLRLLGIPFLLALMGVSKCYPSYLKIPMLEEYELKNKKEQIFLAHLQNGELLLTLGGKYGSGELTPLLNSSFFAIFEKDFGIIHKGECIKVVPYHLELGTELQNIINYKGE